ncbi:MAG TPA: tetratricopeptide repeat protein [Blastocatellia bacterium]|nr:tetratricopeptide repeat protein [Blastocatellia bacterium]
MLIPFPRIDVVGVASEDPTSSSNIISAKPDTVPRGLRAETTERESAQEKVQTAEPTPGSLFDSLRLAMEANPLGATPTRKSAAEAIEKYKAAFAIFEGQGNKIGMAATRFACGAAYFFLGDIRQALSAYLDASRYVDESHFQFLRPTLDISIGAAYASLGESAKALEFLNRALPAFEETTPMDQLVEYALKSMGNEEAMRIYRVKKREMVAFALKNLGQVNARIGERRKALEYLERSRDVYREVSAWQREVEVLTLISVVRHSLGETKEALESNRAAVGLSKEKGGTPSEAHTYMSFGEAHAAAGNHEQAIAEYNRALPLLQERDDKATLSTALNNIGLSYDGLGNKQKALEYYNQALPLHREMKDRPGEATVLNNIGVVFYYSGEKQKALDHFNRALLINREVSSRSDEATTLNHIGVVYNSIGERKKALDYHEQALTIARAAKDRIEEAATLNNIAGIYSETGRKKQALDFLNQALSILREMGDRAREATALNNIGEILDDLGEKPKALEYFNEALPILRELKDRAMEAITLNNIGKLYFSTGEKDKALTYLDQSLAIMQSLGNRFAEPAPLNNLGVLYNSLGERHKALEVFNRVLPMMRSVGDRSGEAATLANIGTVYDNLGEKQKALDFYNQALPILRATSADPKMAAPLNNIGGVYNSIGDKKKALDFYNQALSILRSVGDRSGEASTLNNIGTIYVGLGDVQRGLEYFNKALRLNRAVNDRSSEAGTLANIGTTYDTLGDERKALDSLNAALKIRREIRDRAEEAAVLVNIGTVYLRLEDSKKALEFFDQAMPILQAAGDRFTEASTLTNIGTAYNGLGQPEQALKFLNQALAITRELRSRPAEASTLNNIGAAYYLSGDNRKAMEFLDRALPITREVGDRPGEAGTLANLGHIHEKLGLRQKALRMYLEAVTALEDIRSTATIEEIKTGSIEHLNSAYVPACLLLAGYRRGAEAFDLSERARARTLLDQLGNIHPNAGASTDAQLLIEEQAAKPALVALEVSLKREVSKPSSSAQPDVISSLRTQLAAKRLEYEGLLMRLKLTNPEYASLRVVDTIKLPALQKLLGGDTTLLSYVVAPDKTLAFVITRDSFRTFELKVKESELKEAIAWFREFASLRGSQPQSLTQLHQWLIAPIKKYIRTPVLGIVPYGVLNYLPFTALTDGHRYFGDEHAIFYLPSASVLPFIRKKSKPPGMRMLALAQGQAEGMPDLKFADAEAEAVAAIFSTSASITGNASKADFLKRAADYSLLHIAAHAELNTANPLFSRILLGAKDGAGALEVREIYDLDLSRTSLVVLSACETQLGAHGKGDDIVGLNRAFIYAGAPSVVASLWAVDDEATSLLMKSFYGHLTQGMSKAEALQAAQTETRKRYPDPYYWAAFVLTGDPGKTSAKQPSH